MISMCRLCVAGFALFAATSALANGGAWQVGVPLSGNGTPSDKERTTQVSIEEEQLRIDLHQEFAAVEVRYRMRNNGGKLAQDFFFPVERWAPGDGEAEGTKPADLEDYRITADGTELKWKEINTPAKPTPEAQADENSGDFPPPTRHWKKSEIPLAANQTRELVIRYRARYSGEESGVSDDSHESAKLFIYSLSPAATWKGVIGRGHIAVNILHPRPEEVEIAQPKDRFRKVSDTRFEWSFENLEPTLADDLKIVAHGPSDSYYAGNAADGEQQSPRDYVVEGERYYLQHADFEPTASSTLKAAGKRNYEARNVTSLEGDVTWCEGVDGDGLGESITLNVTRPLPLDSILVLPGYRSLANPSLWTKNNRVAELEVTLNGDHRFSASIPDENFQQAYPIIIRDYSEPVKTVKLAIKAVHRGTAARDTCISSIRLRGKLASKPEFNPAR
jgi:hypothetical protein